MYEGSANLRRPSDAPSKKQDPGDDFKSQLAGPGGGLSRVVY